MRLLHTETLRLELFIPECLPEYVILSHRWSAEEVIFEDFQSGEMLSEDHPARHKAGFKKILDACRRAQQDDYEWIWIDSCCIDKSSSAVLQESINSMWRYYSGANICYAYLADVLSTSPERFLNSEWFDRGWTLQELIAPCVVEFYASDWSPLGSKHQRCDEIVGRTHIRAEVLLDPTAIDGESAANRMSWAAHRLVTRAEDQAYSLLGLFQVNMPMLYGEGRAKAFGRLQEAIYNIDRDESLFLFRYSQYRENLPLLPLVADSPTWFCPREMCESCQKTGVECLPQTIKYNTIIASRVWSLQAHETLLTTSTLLRFEATTTMQLVSKAVFPAQLLRSCNRQMLGKATHIAMLNHTLQQNQDGALCLLIRRSADSQDNAVRLNDHPILIPRWRALISDAHRTEVLFALELRPKIERSAYDMHFVLNSQTFCAYAWECSGSAGLSTKNLNVLNSSCHIQGPKDQEPPLHILCFLYAISNDTTKLLVGLVMVRGTWMIKDVATPSGNGRRRGQKLFIGNSRPVDRCVVAISKQESVLVSVRRLSAHTVSQQLVKGICTRTQVNVDVH